MSKRSVITHITPLPSSVTREAAVGLLHSHVNMINLNPLVLRHSLSTPPPNATREEAQFMIWYELTDEIQYIPGTAMKSEVTYKAGFYDLPTGLQTHSFAPGGVELLGKWTVGGNMPGEPREPMEIGVNKPKEGLYLREEVTVKCSVLLTGFVKKNLKKSHGVLVKRLIESAGQRKPRLERPESIRSSRSDTMLSLRSSSISGPVSSVDSWHSPYGSRGGGPIPPRRSGTQCVCPSNKHLIACPYGISQIQTICYSRIYQPPTLYMPQREPPRSSPGSRPGPDISPDSQPGLDLSRIPSWTITPADEGFPTRRADDGFPTKPADDSYRISLDALGPTYAQSAAPVLSVNHRHSFDSRSYNQEKDWSPVSFEWEPKHFDVGRKSPPKTIQNDEDAALAQRYFEYQTGRIAELE